ncbi:MAG: hypothetical protein ABIU29_00800 [Chthoniobacterales bacterium]
MHSSTSSFERVIPARPWRGIVVSVAMSLVVATAVWEFYCRSLGYGPSLNDTGDLWAEARRRVGPESLVIVGDSRALFGLDLDVLEKGLGKRPVQLAQPGSTAYPVLADVVNDTLFHGTIICGVVPRLFFAPPGSPPMNRSEKAVRRAHTQTLTQRASHVLGVQLEQWFAGMKQDDLTLGALLEQLPIPNRAHALVPPQLPPYFGSLDRERRARMVEQCAQPGKLQERVKHGWIPLFTPPPPPSYLPQGKFRKMMHESFEARMADTQALVTKLRARGGNLVFVRFPVSGDLKDLEDKGTPRAPTWDRLLEETGAPGIHFEDFKELAGFTCPEWSHLSAGDSVEFTERLVPHLRAALGLGRVASSR